jgi:tetratricopeptide (TPR) repeat protein
MIIESALRVLRTGVHVIRHYLKEIIIALVLAVVAAVAVDMYKQYSRTQIRLANLKAGAKLVALGSKGDIIGQGSGLFIKPNGILVTNYHVIKGAADVIAHLPSGAFYKLKGVRDINERTDIAILQFDATETPAVKGLGDSDELQVGDEIYTIGAPVGLEGTIAGGNISNPLQTIDGERFIQFTAPISPGSSGGGLFDAGGEVVGITAATRNIPSGPQAGSAQNLNFAVPINEVTSELSDEASSLVKETPALYYSQGSLADNRKEWDKAIGYYRKAILLDANYADAYIGLGGDYYEKGDFQSEVDNYLKATVAAPNDDNAFWLLGTAYEDVAQFDRAISAYTRALQINPDNKDALHDLSIVFGERSDC